MIRKILYFVIGALLAAAPLSGQNPHRLVIAPAIEQNLDFLAEGLVREYAICLTGRIKDDTGFVEGMTVPAILDADSTSVHPGRCPKNTIAFWHNHPIRTDFDWFCHISAPDQRLAQMFGYKFMVVQIRADETCWWTLEQIKIAKKLNGGKEPYVMHYFENQFQKGDTIDR